LAKRAASPLAGWFVVYNAEQKLGGRAEALPYVGF